MIDEAFRVTRRKKINKNGFIDEIREKGVTKFYGTSEAYHLVPSTFRYIENDESHRDFMAMY